HRNGLIVPGRYGKTSWADPEAGLLREDYEPMFLPDPEVVQGLVAAVSQLVEDRLLRARLGRAARADVAARYNRGQGDRGLKAALDRAGLAGADGRGGTILQGPPEGTWSPDEREVLAR